MRDIRTGTRGQRVQQIGPYKLTQSGINKEAAYGAKIAGKTTDKRARHVAALKRADEIDRHVKRYAENPQAHARALKKLGVSTGEIQKIHQASRPISRRVNYRTKPAASVLSAAKRGDIRSMVETTTRARDIEIARQKRAGTYGFMKSGARQVLEAGGFGIPFGLIAHGHNSTNLKKSANVKSALPLVAGFGLGGVRQMASFGEGGPVGSGGVGRGGPRTNLDLQQLHGELKKSPIRNAFHKNIDETVPDAQLAHRMKQAYDRQVLKESKREGLTPGEYLQRTHEGRPEAVRKVAAGLAGGRAQSLRREQQAFSPSGLARARHVAIETANIPRAIMASFDVSAPFRQGLVAFTRHPILTGKNLKPMFKVLGSENGYRALIEDIRSRPTFPEMERSGLAITDMEHALGVREEPFQSNYAETLTGGKYSPVRASGRAYTGFLVKTRADMFDYLLENASKHGHELDEKALHQLADYINDATGRGNLGRFERSAVGLNSILFSPRLIASRLNFLRPDKYIGLDPFVRREKLKAAMSLVGSMGAVLWLAEQVPGVDVGADPRSSDFGKIRIGDTRLDVTGGFSQYVRILAQIASNQKIDPRTGKVVGGQGLDTTVRFVRGKLSPISSVVADLMAHSDYAYQPLSVKKEIAQRFIPLVLQDAYDLYHNTGSLGAAAAGYAVGATGIGVQTYKSNRIAPKEDLRAVFTKNVKKFYGRDLTPQISKALRLREMRESYLGEKGGKRPGQGASEEDKRTYARTRFDAQVDLLLHLKKINSGQARTAKAWAATKDRHEISSETSRVGRKYFGGDVLSEAAAKIRARGGHLYLSDY